VQLRQARVLKGVAYPSKRSWLLRPEDRDEVRGQPEIFASYHDYPGQLPRETHVAVVECVDLLRSLGHTLLSALIRATAAAWPRSSGNPWPPSHPSWGRPGQRTSSRTSGGPSATRTR
jgi:hypothetical protein